MGTWVSNQTKKGWLTSIFELGAWFGCLYSGFFAEILSRKYAILMNVGIWAVGVVIQCCTSKYSGYNPSLRLYSVTCCQSET